MSRQGDARAIALTMADASRSPLPSGRGEQMDDEVGQSRALSTA